MIQFYQPELETSLCLGPEDSAHCARVLRKQPGDHIFVTDGKGYRYECLVTQCSAKRVDLEIISKEEVPKNWHGKYTLCVAPTKNMDRMEWLVEKGVEIGVDTFIPMLCRHSERREIKQPRLEKIAVSAMKQSLKCVMPRIEEMSSINSILDEPFDGLTVIGYCSDEVPRKEFAQICPPDSNIRILIGPEGDFSPEEIQKALEKGAIPVTFGRERLRTETAALAALHTIHVVNQLKS